MKNVHNTPFTHFLFIYLIIYVVLKSRRAIEYDWFRIQDVQIRVFKEMFSGINKFMIDQLNKERQHIKTHRHKRGQRQIKFFKPRQSALQIISHYHHYKYTFYERSVFVPLFVKGIICYFDTLRQIQSNDIFLTSNICSLMASCTFPDGNIC